MISALEEIPSVRRRRRRCAAECRPVNHGLRDAAEPIARHVIRARGLQPRLDAVGRGREGVVRLRDAQEESWPLHVRGDDEEVGREARPGKKSVGDWNVVERH